MAEKDIGFIPIVDKTGKAAGTVTDRDIVVRSVAKGDDPRNSKLSNYGGNQVVFCMPEDDVSKARKLMQEHQIQRILVCDQGNKPVGVISLQDIAEKEDENQVGKIVQEVKQPSVH